MTSSPANSTILHPPSPNPSITTFNYNQDDDSSQGNDSFDFSAADCIESLVEEDFERIRARRNRAAAAPIGNSAVSGQGEGVDYDLYRSENGIGGSIRNVLPLQSRFYEYAREAFIEPQMRVRLLCYVAVLALIDCRSSRGSRAVALNTTYRNGGDLEMTMFYDKLGNRRRLLVSWLVILSIALDPTPMVAGRQWERRVCNLEATPGSALQMSFHPFDTYLLVSNETNKIK
jgi:hypothetical protein